MKTVALKKKNFRMSFVTYTKLNDTTVLMLMINDVEPMFQLKVHDGRIAFDIGDKEAIRSDVVISDGYYHVVEIIKDGKAWSVKVDGKMERAVNSNEEEMRSVKIYLGGYPNDDNVQKFSGMIKDIFVNDELVITIKTIYYRNA